MLFDCIYSSIVLFLLHSFSDNSIGVIMQNGQSTLEFWISVQNEERAQVEAITQTLRDLIKRFIDASRRLSVQFKSAPIHFRTKSLFLRCICSLSMQWFSKEEFRRYIQRHAAEQCFEIYCRLVRRNAGCKHLEMILVNIHLADLRFYKGRADCNSAVSPCSASACFWSTTKIRFH